MAEREIIIELFFPTFNYISLADHLFNWIWNID